MMYKLGIGAAAAIAALLLGGGVATADKDSQKCAATKLKVTGKDWASKFKCYSKAAGKGEDVTADTCLADAAAKTVEGFAKADGKGGCATDANNFDLNGDTIPDGMVGSIQNMTDNGQKLGGPPGQTSILYRGLQGPTVLPGGGSTPGNRGFIPTEIPNPIPPASKNKCIKTKLKTLGKYAAAIFNCESKAAKKNEPRDEECVDKATAKATDGFAGAEEPGNDCQVTGEGEDSIGSVFQTFIKEVPNMPRFDGCGNGIVTPGESCDDGNTTHFDSCPSDCTIDACTPNATPQPFRVTINDPGVTSVLIELDYPEGKVFLPGTGDNAAVDNLSGAFQFDYLDFDHAIRIGASDAGALGTTDVARLNFTDCNVNPAAVPGDFTCTVTQASDSSFDDVTATTTCAVVVGP